jgi:acyl carrier protein
MPGDGLRDDLHRLISEAFLAFSPALELRDDDKLVELGVLDSIAFVELVEEIQGRYGVDVRDTEITEENFGSVSAIASYVTSKRAA